MNLNCIIVDDEEGAVIVLEDYISKLSYVTLVGKFYNALDAFHFINHNRVDVVLLDINMPEINGFALLDMLGHKPAVIFTTAYSHHAVKGFEYDAIDYLQKPIRFERFVVAIDKAIKRKEHEVVTGVAAINLKINGVERQLQADDIYYTESLGNYIKVFCTNKTHVVLMTTKALESILPGSVFVRIHKSYIINKNKIERYTDDEVTINNELLPIGKTYKKYFVMFMGRQ